jgi:hypothetical protein
MLAPFAIAASAACPLPIRPLRKVSENAISLKNEV